MSASADLQAAIVAILPALLRVPAPVIGRRTKELGAEIEAAAANKGLCIFVMPPLPTSALQGAGEVVFFDKAEIRIRIIEQPALNQTGADAYDLVDDVATGLHWQPKTHDSPLQPILAHPLYLAPRPVEMVEDPQTRIIDVILIAVYQLNGAA